MDINKVLGQYDEMMGSSTEVELQVFLMENLAEARREKDKSAQIALSNELVGITRRTGDKTVAMNSCSSVLSLMEEGSLEKTEEFIIALVNVGTTYRIFGIMDEAMKCFNRADDLIEELRVEDPVVTSLFHNNLGLLFMDRQEFRRAKEHLEKALLIVSKEPTLQTDKEITESNLAYANAQLSITHIERCRNFYEKYGRPMIEKKFRQYSDRIAVGLVGEGSECFGFDDDYSRDHDFIVGFCMWLNEDDYREIGGLLQQEYELLVSEYCDGGRELQHVALRRGVFTVRDFYRSILQMPQATMDRLMSENREEVLTMEDWLSFDEEQLATVTNGEVFAAGDGTFLMVRDKLLKYFPQKVWKMNLAQQLHIFAQSGQYNYARMMARADFVTAKICLARALDAGMRILYLLNRGYAPYYKWRRKGLEKYENTGKALEILDKIATSTVSPDAWKRGYNPYVCNRDDAIACGLEDLAGEILYIMKEMKLVEGENTFLDIYSKEIAKG